MSEKFRVGLTSMLRETEGRLLFPSYDVSSLIAEGNVEIEYFPPASPIRAADIAGFDALVLFGEVMAADSFPGDGRLSLIARMGVGYDTVDLTASSAHDVAVCITPESARRPMAQATLTLLLALSGQLIAKDRMTRGGPAGWSKRMDHHGVGLHGRTLGIIGIGNIGRELVEMVRPLGMRLIASDPAWTISRAEEIGVELMATDEVFRQSDFISLHCPLTAETRHIADAKRIASMKPGSYLINTARGPVADQRAVYDALVSGQLAGAALDVLDPEPSALAEPLNQLDNVILTPHAMGWTDHMFAAMAAANMAAMRAIMAGDNPRDTVNSEVLAQAGFQAKLKAYSS